MNEIDNTPSTITEEDLNDILENNGLHTSEEEESYDENQGEETDFDAESLLEEARETFNRALEDEVAARQESTPETSEEAQVHTANPKSQIPINSPTLLMDESTTRFSGAEWFNEIKKQRVIIAGIGGIGANLAFQIARMTPSALVLYDDDQVEAVNMAGQLYSRNDIGKAKVDAMADMISNYTSTSQVIAVKEKFTNTTQAGNVMMCGFDNMRARKIFFESWKQHVNDKVSQGERAKCLFLDGRLSMDTLQIFCIRGDDEYNINRYRREFLFSDYEADATVCSRKQTTYLACMIGSLMTNLFTNFVASSLNPIIPYDLPFFIEYDAQNMIFKVER